MEPERWMVWDTATYDAPRNDRRRPARAGAACPGKKTFSTWAKCAPTIPRAFRPGAPLGQQESLPAPEGQGRMPKAEGSASKRGGGAFFS